MQTHPIHGGVRIPAIFPGAGRITPRPGLIAHTGTTASVEG